MEQDNFSVEDFLRKIQIDSSGSCEYESTEKALDSYLTYDCFDKNGWNKQKEGNKYYLKNDDEKHILLTADIITSITKPLLLSGMKNTTGQRIFGKNVRDWIESDFNDSFGLTLQTDNEKLKKSIKAFANVYYTIGNMMPVACNYRPGRGFRDHWNAKLCCIKNCFQHKTNIDVNIIDKRIFRLGQNRGWPVWIQREWEEKTFKHFVKEYYLEDMVDDNGDIKPIGKLDESWFETNAKLIIQRGYRIIYKKHGSFEKQDKENLKLVYEKLLMLE